MVQSIDEQLDTITQDVADTYTALGAKGATLPAKKGTSNLKATVDSLPKGGFPYQLYSVNANGTASIMTSTLDDSTFSGLVESGKYCFQYFSQCAGMLKGKVCFPDLKIANYYSFNNFNGSSREAYVDKDSFPNLTTVTTAFNNFGVKIKGDLDFPKLQNCTGFYQAFRNVSSDTSFTVRMNSLKTVNYNSFYECFYKTKISEFYCDSLEVLPGSGANDGTFYGVFGYCDYLTKVSFANLTTVEGGFSQRGLDATFNHCKNLVEVNIPKLKEAVLRSTFSGCTSLTEMNFHSLTTMLSTWDFVFMGCTSLKKVSFPMLQNAKSFGTYTFDGCTALTEIHFRADMQATVEALSGYASKWGATNATIYFDL